MWIQLITIGILFGIGLNSMTRAMFADKEERKILHILILAVIIMLLTAVTIALAVELNNYSEGCPKLELIQEPLYRKL